MAGPPAAWITVAVEYSGEPGTHGRSGSGTWRGTYLCHGCLVGLRDRSPTYYRKHRELKGPKPSRDYRRYPFELGVRPEDGLQPAKRTRGRDGAHRNLDNVGRRWLGLEREW